MRIKIAKSHPEVTMFSWARFIFEDHYDDWIYQMWNEDNEQRSYNYNPVLWLRKKLK